MLKSRPLGTLRITLGESYELPGAPLGSRRIDVFREGRFSGRAFEATMVAGSDALLFRADGIVQPDVRLVLRTDDGETVFVHYRGLRHGPADVMQRIARGEVVPHDSYYLRTSVFFETGAERYRWLNGVLAVGVGHREPGGVVYEIHEIL